MRRADGERYRNRERLTGLIPLLLDCLSDADLHRLCLSVRLDQHDEKLVTSVSNYEIAPPHLLAEEVRHLPQNPVPDPMVQALVYLCVGVVNVSKRIPDRLLLQFVLQADMGARPRDVTKAQLEGKCVFLRERRLKHPRPSHQGADLGRGVRMRGLQRGLLITASKYVAYFRSRGSFGGRN